MSKLTEEMVQVRTRQSNLAAVSKLNCWGCELYDVSLVRRLPNVETISFSVNLLRSLVDFQYCKKLKHLFVRKNNIKDLNQVCYLQECPVLTTLWLAENPCASSPGYRSAVIKTLPKIEKLDDIPVTEEERESARRMGDTLSHPDDDPPRPHSQSPENDVEPESVPGYNDEEQDTEQEQYTPQDYGHQYNTDYSSEVTSSGHQNYMLNAANSYIHEESAQNNGYEAPHIYDHIEADYRPHQEYSSSNHHTPNKGGVADDNSPPRSLRHDSDDNPPPRSLAQSRTESLPRLTRYGPVPSDDYHSGRDSHYPYRLDATPRGSRLDLDDSESHPRANLTRSHTVDMLGQRQQPCSVYCRATQPAPSRARNINVLNAVLCLIKELELQDLELVALSVNCRIDELRV